ncbi:MAG: alpha/beta fold hydrolase [Pseudomonadota bacterium]
MFFFKIHIRNLLNKAAFFSLCMFCLTACSIMPPEKRVQLAQTFASASEWQKQIIVSGEMFDLASFIPATQHKSSVLTVYIEGDGFAWSGHHRPSLNPTPHDPLALKLALAHPPGGGNAVYLSRPCQYVNLDEQPACDQRYWTSHRFAPEVIRSTSKAIDSLKNKFGAESLVLIGYSGGGALAALVAAHRRNDVARLVTVAGNLDIKAWSMFHQLTPLEGSLNPADFWQRLVDIPQVHYVGGKDKVMPELISRAYARRFPAEKKPKIVVMEDFDHHCCWSNGALQLDITKELEADH